MGKSTYLVLVAACLAVGAFAEEEELYSNKYDETNVDAILENDRLRNQYFKCFLDTAPCVTADAIFFKGIVAFKFHELALALLWNALAPFIFVHPTRAEIICLIRACPIKDQSL